MNVDNNFAFNVVFLDQMNECNVLLTNFHTYLSFQDHNKVVKKSYLRIWAGFGVDNPVQTCQLET